MATLQKNPMPHYLNHLTLIEGMINTTEAAVSKHQQNIKQLLQDGGNVVPETNALRANLETLRRLKSDRAATLHLIAKQSKSSSPPNEALSYARSKTN
jgi:hypothetical protein